MKAAKIDFKIVSLHWGHEYEYYPTIAQAKLAREIVALGADVIVGSHPHVQQPIEICEVNGYRSVKSQASPCQLKDSHSQIPRKALIIYSLGNFITVHPSPGLQLGLNLGISIFRNAESAIDWQEPKFEWIKNLTIPSRRGVHQTMLWSEYLSADCVSAECTDEETRIHSYVRCLVEAACPSIKSSQASREFLTPEEIIGAN